jgi:NAD(P)-dependent dehydrogenase (short-subunit alcohol dehydrogenase family)
MDYGLTNKTALVTGSTAGIGLATAKKLAGEGAIVYINGRTRQRIDEAVKHIRAEFPKAELRSAMADFSDLKQIDALIASIPHLDILINNVAIFQPKAFTEIPDEEWFRFFDINVMSGIRLSRHYFPKMIEKNWGRIIFISSESGVNIPEEMIHYGMTKTAQLAVSRGLAELTRATNVTVNSVLPGPTKSEGVSGFVEELGKSQNKTKEEVEKEFFKTARPSNILQRFATTDEIANLIVYVASELSSATNGAALKVDGGTSKFII